MALDLLDSVTAPGNAAKPNDDAFCAGPRMAAVFDGATSLGEPLLPGESDAAWIAHLGAERLLAHADTASGRDLLRQALTDVQAAYVRERRRPPAETYELPLASLMMVELGADDGLEAHWFGDCCALVQRPGERVEVVGEAFDNRLAEAGRAAEAAAASGLAPAGDVNRPEFLAGLRTSRNRCNTEGGPWVFAPDPRCAAHAEAARVRAPAGTMVLVASDGFLALASDYGRYDADAFMAATLARGLQALLDEVRAVEAADPEGRLHPRFKTSDDATALLLRIE